jgi:hypothetical protein
MKSEEVIRYFREACGDFHPEANEENKRFVLPVDINADGHIHDVPIFVRRTEGAEYPQVRLSTFRANGEQCVATAYTWSPGVPPYEDPNIEYRRARVDTKVHRAQLQVDIYSLDKLQTYRIRDELTKRIHKFFYVETASFVEFDWVQDISPTGLYYNTGYDTSINIIAAYEGDSILTKSDDVTTKGTWNLTDEGLFVNPLIDIDKIKFYEITNGGYVFNDGFTTQAKGFLAYDTIRSRPMEDENPLISRWTFTFRLDYREDIIMDVGRTFKELSVNGENNK